jgi:glycosyltransferase involved in cell wall biosynthesis
MNGAEVSGDFVPAFVGQVELSGPPPALEAPAKYGRARLLARFNGTPLGIIDVPLTEGQASGEAIAAEAADQLGELAGRPSPPIDDQRLVSVILCTRDHPEELARAVASVLACDYPKLELVVVDNSPSTDATRELIEGIDDQRLHYVLEPIAGLSRARNRGLAEAKGEIIAYTDDDVEVDAGWIRGLLEGFELGDHVGLVTGVIPMGALENEFQQYFDDRVQWSDNFEPRLFDLKTNKPGHPLYPYSAGIFGTGANFAIRAEAVKAIGPFDEALGAGAPTRGGEDLDYFVRTLYTDGWQIAYEPSALVWHYHRADAGSLAQQMYGYGTGLTAYAFKTALQPSHFIRVCRMTAAFLWRRLVRRDTTYGVDTGHGELQKLQRKGLLAGPWLYVKAWRIARANPPIS